MMDFTFTDMQLDRIAIMMKKKNMIKVGCRRQSFTHSVLCEK